MVLLGEGTAKDTAKGIWWLEQSFANGISISARLLGEIYADGFNGVERNPELAAFWQKKWADSAASAA
jgi:TPR repeat protein